MSPLSTGTMENKPFARPGHMLEKRFCQPLLNSHLDSIGIDSPELFDKDTLLDTTTSLLFFIFKSGIIQTTGINGRRVTAVME
jgi:hypothetical protein